MHVSNPIQFNAVRLGDTLLKCIGTSGAVGVLGVVTELSTNSRGNRVAVLDRVCSLNGSDYSNRITERAMNHANVRKLLPEPAPCQ